MKFKVGDTIRYSSLKEEATQLALLIIKIEPNKYIHQDGYFSPIDVADKYCFKVNHIKSKLGKVLYAKSNRE